MKKIVRFSIYTLLSVGGMSLDSCSADNFTSQQTNFHDPNVIKMSVLLNNPQDVSKGYTRAAETTLTSLETVGNNFMVWGYFSPSASSAGAGNLYVGDSHTVGTVISYTSTGWDYADVSKKALWPSTENPLNFQAVTPYDYGTITNTPADDIAKVAMTVSVPSDQAQQKDLLFGHEEEVTQSSHDNSVQLTFEHAMAQVGFQARKTLSSLSVVIGGVTIHNVRNSATIGYTGALTGSKRALAASDYAASVADYAIGMTSSAVTISGTTAVTLNAEDGVLMMLPQSSTDSPDAWGTSSSSAVPITTADIEGSEQSYLEVLCRVSSGSSYIIGTPTTFGSIYIPFKAEWGVGCRYIYTLSFGSGAGGYDENGNIVLPLISYSVESMDDWKEVESSTLPKGTETVNNSEDIL